MPNQTTSSERTGARGESGIILAIVLVLIFVLVTAVYAFQRQAFIDTSIAKNRLRSSEAEALARGGIRIAEAIVFVLRLKEDAPDSGGEAESLVNPSPAAGAGQVAPDLIWSQMGQYPIELARGQTLRVSIEDEGARLNLNALVPQSTEEDGASDGGQQPLGSGDEAELYLMDVLDYIVGGMEGAAEDVNYDTRAIAKNLLDYMDVDDDPRDGRAENSYYQDQDPPYAARNGPFLSFDEIGLVEGVDPLLLRSMREYLTVHPIGGTAGININRAEPWVLRLLYVGVGGDRELVREQTVRDIWSLRGKSKILCDDSGYDPARCVSPGDVSSGELSQGSIYPETAMPAKVRVFRIVAEATIDNLTRRIEAIVDTRSRSGPQLLSWRRLRGPNS